MCSSCASRRRLRARACQAGRGRPGPGSRRLGVPAVDALAGALGIAAFEPEFRGEPAADRSRGADFTAFLLVHLARWQRPGAALERLRALPDVASADPIALLPSRRRCPTTRSRFATYWLFKDQAQRTTSGRRRPGRFET